MFHRTKVDLLWTDAGDFVLDTVKGDLKDTTSLSYRALIQQIYTRVSSSSGDWRLQPSIGANLTNFLGKANTAVVGKSIQGSVTSALVAGGFLKSTEFTVEVFPISTKEVAILLTVRPAGDRDQVKLAFSYNSTDNKVIPRSL